MGITFNDVVPLLYHQVKVVTKIDRGCDSKSKFIITNRDGEESNCRNPKEKLAFAGYLKVIDPNTEATILCYIEDNLVKENLLILGQVISHIEIYRPNDSLPPNRVEQIIETDSVLKVAQHSFFRNETHPQLTTEEVIERRDAILLWLDKNRIPSTYDVKTNDIILDGSVRIKAPYKHQSDYVCPTRVILMRVQHIIDLMSKN